MKYVIDIDEETCRQVKWYGLHLSPKYGEDLVNAINNGMFIPTGTWEFAWEIEGDIKAFECSNCSCEVELPYGVSKCKYGVCPNCGAFMDVEGEEE